MVQPALSPKVLEDVALAQRCAAGERPAERQLFERQRVQVHRTLFRILGTNRQIEDLVQETFVAVFGSIDSFRGDSSLATWIDTIAARICYRHLSRPGSRAHHLQAVVEVLEPSPDAEQQMQAREALRRLYSVLDRIEPKCRVAFALHVVDGRPIKDVARVTRASTMAVKNRIWRARRAIRERAQRDPLLVEFLSDARTSP